ncbi:MAG TPA: tyrosinase family protein, partial [Myxococcaceae bacterium]|nr:tyrosinase family protein [Myxococcaceae bacterium]
MSPGPFALLLGTLLVASALAGCSEPARQRKNIKDLTPAERQDFVNAVLALKRTPSPYDGTLSWYDQFVLFHRQVYEYRRKDTHDNEYQIGHESPTFLPWHRKFLFMYEQALSEVSGKDISLPYWDWTDTESLGVLFAEDFMGPSGDKDSGYAVLSGPFRKDTWKIQVFPKDQETKQEITTPWLIRRRGDEASPIVPLPTTADMEECLRVETYDVTPWNKCSDRAESFRNCLEGWGTTNEDNHMHNTAHIWVGGVFMDNGMEVMGSMAAVDTSPNDPIFFLHHANVDRLWAEWQQRHGISYLPNGDGRPGWNPGESLYPCS